MEKNFRKNIYTTLVLYNLLFLLVALIFYFAIPIFLNYPPYSINTEFEKTIDMGFNYYVQYIFIVIAVMLISNSIFIFEINKIKDWKKYKDENNIDKLFEIKEKCFSIPIKLYIIHAILPALGTCIGLIISGGGIMLASKISFSLLALFITIGLLVYVFSKRLFEKVLTEINNEDILDEKKYINTYRARFFFQFLPLVLLMGTYSYLVVSSVAIEEKGNLLFNNYYTSISQLDLYDNINIEDAINEIKKVEKYSENDTYFIIKKDKVIYQDTDKEISDFFMKYTFQLDNKNHTYGYYASDIQGAYKFIEIDNEKYAIGVMYEASLSSGYLYIFGVIFILLLMVIEFLIIFSKDFTTPILQIAKHMDKLASGYKVDYDKKIPVTSNDELGELTVNFNKILDLEKHNMETIEHNKEALIESERLSSLGQLIGGVAHNLKTPIMSISGNLQGLQDLITEYDVSVGDEDVTIDDHKDIAKDMQKLVDKMRVHLSYMSDVISAVKGQAVQLDSSQEAVFSPTEIVSRIEILMRHELKNALVELKSNITDDAKVSYIKGDINSLVQVFNNFIQNAIYAYKGKQNGIIELNVSKIENKLCFEIKDYGCGIPEHVQEKLFKEMITTKGKNGTGLGLYMSYSTIKGKFNGELNYESKVGKGTTFNIIIPINEVE